MSQAKKLGWFWTGMGVLAFLLASAYAIVGWDWRFAALGLPYLLLGVAIDVLDFRAKR